MAILAATDRWGNASLHTFEVLAASLEVAAVAGAITGPFPVVATLGTGALQSNVEGRPVHEGREAFFARHAPSQGLSERRINKAKGPLASVELVGSWLPLV